MIGSACGVGWSYGLFQMLFAMLTEFRASLVDFAGALDYGTYDNDQGACSNFYHVGVLLQSVHVALLYR